METNLKILLIGNCQTGTYQKLIKARLPQVSIETLTIHTLAADQYQKKHDELRKYDLIFTQFISAKFGPLCTEHLKTSYPDKVISLLNIFFNGLHPDFGYVNYQGKRLQSIIGEYHSKIAFESYDKGLSVSACLKLYNEESYNKRGYNKVWEQSINELVKRESSLDVTFASELNELSLSKHTMLSFNHPRAFVLDAYLTNIFKYAGLKTRTYDTSLLNDPLLEAAILPIYSYVTQSNSLPYSYNNSLKQPERLGGRYLEFNEFIEESYTLYDKQIN